MADYQLTIAEQPGYVHFRATGENTPQAVRGYLSEIYAACAERGSTAILVEEDLAGPGLPMVEIYQIIESGGVRGRPLLRRIAYVDVRQQERAGNTRFAETVALNRGLNLRSFVSVEEAAAWLRDAEQPLAGTDAGSVRH